MYHIKGEIWRKKKRRRAHRRGRGGAPGEVKHSRHISPNTADRCTKRAGYVQSRASILYTCTNILTSSCASCTQARGKKQCEHGKQSFSAVQCSAVQCKQACWPFGNTFRWTSQRQSQAKGKTTRAPFSSLFSHPPADDQHDGEAQHEAHQRREPVVVLPLRPEARALEDAQHEAAQVDASVPAFIKCHAMYAMPCRCCSILWCGVEE